MALELNLILIIDERKGRKIALNQGLKIVGVLGILIENYRKEFITLDELKLYFLLFKEQGLRVSEQLENVFFEKLKPYGAIAIAPSKLNLHKIIFVKKNLE